MENGALRSLEWSGWTGGTFCLEVQMPWSELILARRKTIEVRSYELPTALVGQKIYILQSPSNDSTTSSFGDQIELGQEHDDDDAAGPSLVRLVGWGIFSQIIKFESESSFNEASDEHLVTPGSTFSWRNGTTSRLYGWVVEKVGRDIPSEGFLAVRRMRSLFELTSPGEGL